MVLYEEHESNNDSANQKYLPFFAAICYMLYVWIMFSCLSQMVNVGLCSVLKKSPIIPLLGIFYQLLFSSHSSSVYCLSACIGLYISNRCIKSIDWSFGCKTSFNGLIHFKLIPYYYECSELYKFRSTRFNKNTKFKFYLKKENCFLTQNIWLFVERKIFITFHWVFYHSNKVHSIYYYFWRKRIRKVLCSVPACSCNSFLYLKIVSLICQQSILSAFQIL